MVPFKITFIFILILFIDSVNRVYRVQLELSAYSKELGGAGYVTIYSPLNPSAFQLTNV